MSTVKTLSAVGLFFPLFFLILSVAPGQNMGGGCGSQGTGRHNEKLNFFRAAPLVPLLLLLETKALMQMSQIHEVEPLSHCLIETLNLSS